MENKNLLDIVKNIFGENTSCSDCNHILNKYTNFTHDSISEVASQLELAKVILDEKQSVYNLTLQEVIALDK